MLSRSKANEILLDWEGGGGYGLNCKLRMKIFMLLFALIYRLQTDLEMFDDVTWFRLIFGSHEAEGIKRHMVIQFSSWNSSV